MPFALCRRLSQPCWQRAAPLGSTMCRHQCVTIARDERAACRPRYEIAPLWRRAALRAMCCRRHIAIARDEHAAFPPRSAAALPSHAGGGPRYVPPPARRVTSPGSSSPVEAGPRRRRFGLRRRHGPRARRQRVREASSPNELDTVGDGAVSLSLVNWHLSGRLGVTAEAPAHGAGGSDPGP